MYVCIKHCMFVLDLVCISTHFAASISGRPLPCVARNADATLPPLCGRQYKIMLQSAMLVQHIITIKL
jgi:hypothetical protein